MESNSNPYQVKHEPPKELTEAYRYIALLQGKGVRTTLMDAFNVWLKLEKSQVVHISNLIAILHNSSLMVDDIEDNSKLRRGSPVCHSVYGTAITINTANYMYFVAMQDVCSMGQPEAIKVFLEELLNLHRGQGYDILWRDSYQCPTEEQYKEMVLDKTGGLFRLCLRLMQVFSEDKRNYLPLVNDLSLYFQIRDDYINLKSEDYAKNKSFAEDLTEGKYSFPIIAAIKAAPDDNRLKSILKQKTEDANLKQHAVKFMESVEAFSYTEKVLADLQKKIRQQIADFGGNNALSHLLDILEKNKI